MPSLLTSTKAHEDSHSHQLLCAALANHDSESQRQLCISVETGVAILSGMVATQAQGDELTRLARSSGRVRAVLNLTCVAGTSELTDLEITQRIACALRQHPDLTADTVLITVKGGVVDLDGVVRTPEDRRTCERIAALIPGVGRVRNHLVANLLLHVWCELDVRKIRQVLRTTPGLQHSRIDVAYAGEVVELFGNVDQAWEKELAEMAVARETSKLVVNHIFMANKRNRFVAS